MERLVYLPVEVYTVFMCVFLRVFTFTSVFVMLVYVYLCFYTGKEMKLMKVIRMMTKGLFRILSNI